MARRGNMTDIQTEGLLKKSMHKSQETVFQSGFAEGQQFGAVSATLNAGLANKDPGTLNYRVLQLVDNVSENGLANAPVSDAISSYATSLDWIDLEGFPNQNLDSQINKAAANSNRASQRYPTYQKSHNLLVCATGRYSDLTTQKYGPDYEEDQNKYFVNNDYLKLTNLSRLMDLTSGRPEVMIGLIDGPVDISHPDFSGSNIISVSSKKNGVCAIKDSNACMHGTFVAGIISGNRNSKALGICPGCTLLLRPIFPEDISTDTPRSTPEELSEAIIECVNADANIINMSVGLTHPTRNEEMLKSALDYAAKRGVIVVAAAGNQGTIGGSNLTNHPWVIPVTACGSNGRPMNTSNFGRSIGISGLSAPGMDVISLAPDSRSLTLSGTSVAAPFVSGAIALLWSIFPETNAVEIKRALRQRRFPATIVPPLLDALAAYNILVQNKNIRRDRKWTI